MGWYALYKWFSKFRKTPYTNMINWYKEKLFLDWYDSLTEEEKDKYNKIVENKNLSRREKILQLVAFTESCKILLS
jgi:hypothetical protein